MRKHKTKHVPTNFRLSFTARALLDALQVELGVTTRTAVMEAALRVLADVKNVTVERCDAELAKGETP